MDGPSRTLYVENFPLTTTTELVRKLFSNFGPIRGVDLPTFDASHPMCRVLKVPKAKGYAFVEFARQEDAEKACKLFNDLTFILSAASKMLGRSKLTDEIELALSKSSSSRQSAIDHTETTLRQSVMSSMEFRKLLLIRVMTKQQFQALATHYNEQRFQALVKAAKLLVVS